MYHFPSATLYCTLHRVWNMHNWHWILQHTWQALHCKALQTKLPKPQQSACRPQRHCASMCCWDIRTFLLFFGPKSWLCYLFTYCFDVWVVLSLRHQTTSANNKLHVKREIQKYKIRKYKSTQVQKYRDCAQSGGLVESPNRKCLSTNYIQKNIQI